MKRILLLSVTALCLVISGCNKDKTATSTNVIKATIGTTAWQSSTANVADISSSMITISGTVALPTPSSLAIDVVGTTTGTYDLDPTKLLFQCTCAYTSSSQGTYTSVRLGKVTISKIDATAKTITGTFSFTVLKNGTLSDTLQIKNGSFSSIHYTEN